ncbi:hypothetical protein TNCV_4013601 [Trichonephila clavipes]|nr:hypothetical protein TNCV_4013601 [Trichonephila clavipes]
MEVSNTTWWVVEHEMVVQVVANQWKCSNYIPHSLYCFGQKIEKGRTCTKNDALPSSAAANSSDDIIDQSSNRSSNPRLFQGRIQVALSCAISEVLAILIDDEDQAIVHKSSPIVQIREMRCSFLILKLFI